MTEAQLAELILTIHKTAGFVGGILLAVIVSATWKG